MVKNISLALLLPLFFMTLCNSKGNSGSSNTGIGETQVQWKELLSGQGSSIVVDSQVICVSMAEFDKIWEAAFNDYPGQYEKPVIDFKNNFVICCFRGNVRSAGYAVKVKRAEKIAGALKVFLEYTEPGQGCMNASVIETPFTIISVAGNGKMPVEYIKEKNVTKCD